MEVFASGGGLGAPTGLAFGPDGNLYVGSHDNDQVLRYDGTTGAFIDVFASDGGLSDPADLVFGPDGHLYVSGWGSSAVHRYDGTTGTFMDLFVGAQSGGLLGPVALAFRPDGNLYIASSKTDQVLRYNGTTGAFIDVFASGAGLDYPLGIAFGPDGELYVGDESSDRVLRFDGTTGEFLDVYVAAGSGGLDHPGGLLFGPNGHLYVASRNTDLRYAGLAGAVTAGEVLHFSLKTGTGFAFSTGTDSRALEAFTDRNGGLGWGGSILEETSANTWVLHCDDVGSTDDDDNDVLIQIRLAPELIHVAPTTGLTTTETGATAYLLAVLLPSSNSTACKQAVAHSFINWLLEYPSQPGRRDQRIGDVQGVHGPISESGIPH